MSAHAHSCSRLLVRELAFLAEAEADTLVGGVMRAFSDEINLLCLELGVAAKLTGGILREHEVGVRMREVNESVSSCGTERMIERCQAKAIKDVAQFINRERRPCTQAFLRSRWNTSLVIGVIALGR